MTAPVKEQVLLSKLADAIVEDLETEGFEVPSCKDIEPLLAVVEVLNSTCQFQASRLVAREIAANLAVQVVNALREREFDGGFKPELKQYNWWEELKCMIQKGYDYSDYHPHLVYLSEACESVTGYPDPPRPSVLAVNVLYSDDPKYDDSEDKPDGTYDILMKHLQKIAETDPLDNDPGDIDIYNRSEDDELDGLIGFKIEDEIIVQSLIGAAKASLIRHIVHEATTQTLSDNAWRCFGYPKRPRVGKIFARLFRPTWKNDFETKLCHELMVTSVAAHLHAGTASMNDIEDVIARILQFGEVITILGYDSADSAIVGLHRCIQLYAETAVTDWGNLMAGHLEFSSIPDQRMVAICLVGCAQHAITMRQVIEIHRERSSAS